MIDDPVPCTPAGPHLDFFDEWPGFGPGRFLFGTCEDETYAGVATRVEGTAGPSW
eukprot:CAMPEP_0114242762 /NCGR_PEP_ID=MMETSP0058-20121206/10363_1 /TAXON_ID=36894 /ORGANISM="Pyramimonas parkeae, CCMP726" /LENGTH=54 /DNA_ID=CAMNT_0001355425 /DNA_START=2392 /DNA_END=2553 /DNA_ORIENTATION=+